MRQSDGCVAEKERLASERLQSSNNKASSLGAALATLREEMAEVMAKLDSQGEEVALAQQRCSKLEDQRDQVDSAKAASCTCLIRCN